MSLLEAIKARQAEERRHREWLLDQVRRRLARRAWTVDELAIALEWPGGRIGVPGALRELQDLGEAECGPDGRWTATRDAVAVEPLRRAS